MDKTPSGLRMPCCANFMATATARLAPALSPTIITRSPVQPDCNSSIKRSLLNKHILHIQSGYSETKCQWPSKQATNSKVACTNQCYTALQHIKCSMYQTNLTILIFMTTQTVAVSTQYSVIFDS